MSGGDQFDEMFAQDRPASVAKTPAAKLRQTVGKTPQTVRVQSITAGAGSEVHDNEQNVKISLANREFFFNIILKTKSEDELSPDAVLEAGDIYRASISVAINRSEKTNLKQRPIKIQTKLDLSLKADDFEIINNKIISLEIANWQNWREEFQVSLQDSSQSQTSLRLDFRESGRADFLLQAAQLNVSSPQESNFSTKPVTLPNVLHADENAAVLYIKPDGSEWSLEGFYSQQTLRERVRKQKNLGLDVYARKYLGKLLKWLREAIAYFDSKYGQCSLAIVDHTSEQTPWEMVKLKPSEYLGVKATVVRWAEQEAWGETVALDLTKPQVYQGRIVAYVHPEDIDNSPFPQAHTSLSKWQEDAIAQPIAPVVLIHCNGHLSYGDEPESWTWESLSCQRQPIKVDFEEIANYVKRPSFFFFANAPYSARLIWDDSVPCGVAANALAQVASGYIGTMTEIEEQFARLVKNKFLELAGKDVGIKPADFLRRIRFYYADNLTSKDKQKKTRANQVLTYVFSYVYYGNPDDVVKITGGSQP